MGSWGSTCQTFSGPVITCIGLSVDQDGMNKHYSHVRGPVCYSTTCAACTNL